MDLAKEKQEGSEEFEDEQTSRRSMLDGKRVNLLSIMLACPASAIMHYVLNVHYERILIGDKD